ncbi:MAG: hypothetical protein GY851_17810 [bacterium]|nr:hypothetical protein [bacterium]
MKHAGWPVAMAMAVIGLGGNVVQAQSNDAIALTRAWAEQTFANQQPASKGNALFIVHDDETGTAKVNRSSARGPLRLSDATYDHGIGVNSNCTLRVRTQKPVQRVCAVIGVDRNADGSVASVVFRVRAGDQEVFASDVMRAGDPPREIDVALNGVREFDLIVDDAGDGRAWDQADWANARAVLEDGTELRLDELAEDPFLPPFVPFSFVYDGRPSADFLLDWEWAATVEPVDDATVRRVITITDPATRLEVRAECLVYLDAAGVDWTIHFTNRGDADTPVLEQVNAVDWMYQFGVGPATSVFDSLKSTAGVEDWQPFEQGIGVGQRHAFAPTNGRSSMGACPFFTLRWPGGGVVTAIGWTGQWHASVYNSGYSGRIVAGMQNLHARLQPGESIRTPRILQLHWKGDDPAQGYNLFRKTMMARISPRVQGDLAVPPIAHTSTSFYEMDRGTEDDVLSHLESIEGLGFEYFWLDAYRGRTVFPKVGHYVFPIEREVDPVRFPNGLQPIGKAAKDAGMKFLLWFEPERICPGTLMTEEHPEWVVLPEQGPWGMFNLAIPEARQHITDYLNTAVRQYGIDCLRIDNAVQYTPLWAKLDQAAGPDRVGIAEIRYVEGLYRMWDDILAANPHLFIDNVSSGGQRIDLELCSRAIPLWRTDATIHPLMQNDFAQAAIQNQVMTAGLSRYVPLSTCGQSGSTPYLFRSGFNAGITFCEDIRGEDYPKDMLKAAIAEGKRIRKYFFGDLYALKPITVNADDWCVLQYDRPGHGDGLILAFRRHESPFTAFEMSPRGIDAAATYEVVVSPGYDRPEPVTMTGAELMEMDIHVEDRPGSVIVEYRKTKP